MKKNTSLVGWAIFCMLFINLNQFALAANDSENNEKEIIAAEGQDESDATDGKKDVFSVDLLVDATSRDVDKYSGAIGEGWISHQGVTLTHNPSGAYLNALSYVKEDGLNEVDLLVGWSVDFHDITLDGGGGYYAVDDDEDWLAWYLEVTLPQFAGFTPSAYIEANYGVDDGRGGIFWKFKIQRDFEIFGREFAPEFEIGGNDGLYGYNPEFISFGRLTVSTEIEMSDAITVTPFVAVQKGGAEDGIANDATLVYAGVTASFSLF
ncbi:MAG TPA: hypothetical protein DIC35_03875 [Candidatus Moranbacteria bacterium]|nr:hypothetical protein [Candidatus Moranbacteria bacterium]